VKDTVFEELQAKWRRLRKGGTAQEGEESEEEEPPPPELRAEFKALVTPLPGLSVNLGVGRRDRDAGTAALAAALLTPRGGGPLGVGAGAKAASPQSPAATASPRVVPLPALGPQDKGRLALAGAAISQDAGPRPAIEKGDEGCVHQ